MKILCSFIVILLLAGCSANAPGGYNVVVDTTVVESHRDISIAKTDAAVGIAMACRGGARSVKETIEPIEVEKEIINDDGSTSMVTETQYKTVKETTYVLPKSFTCAKDDYGCQMTLLVGDMVAADCVESVGENASKVAIQVPQIRARGAVGVMNSICGPAGCLANSGALTSAWLGVKAFSFGRDTVSSMADVAINSAGSVVDNRVTTTTNTTDSYNTTEANGNSTTTVGDGSVVGRGQIGDNTSTVVDNGSQIGDGIIAGGSVAGLGQCSGNQCQPVDSQNPIVNNEPDPIIPDPAPVPGDADGVCFTFSVVPDPDCP